MSLAEKADVTETLWRLAYRWAATRGSEKCVELRMWCPSSGSAEPLGFVCDEDLERLEVLLSTAGQITVHGLADRKLSDYFEVGEK